jgi:hypothetical protein
VLIDFGATTAAAMAMRFDCVSVSASIGEARNLSGDHQSVNDQHRAQSLRRAFYSNTTCSQL